MLGGGGQAIEIIVGFRFSASLFLTGILQEVKVHSPDYRDSDKEEALHDFMQRIEHYQRAYQTLNEEDEATYSFMKIFNAGEKVLVHRHEGI